MQFKPPKILLLTAAMGCAAMADAQSLERQVIGSTGRYAQSGGIALSYTVGELSVASLFSSNLILTQGFQQPGNVSTAVPSGPVMEGFSLFPSPATNQIQLQYPAVKGLLTLGVYNAVGQLVHAEKFEAPASGNLVLACAPFASGVYFTRVTTEQSNELFYSKFQIIR